VTTKNSKFIWQSKLAF